MAILRNREVNYLGPAEAGEKRMSVRVEDKQTHAVETCELGELRFTEDEVEDLKKAEGVKYAVISDKELKDLRASQDPKQADKLAEKQRKDM